jgi:type II secretory pathway component PulK
MPKTSKKGFALIVALFLSSLILVMILAMSSMLRTETQNSVNDKNQEKAKLNALLGLGIALSELQKTMGPDQRVSARADLLDGSGDSGIHAALQKSHWTGVWNTSNYNPELPREKRVFRLVGF